MIKNILVVGATGQQGRAVIDALLSYPASPFTILGLTRSPNGPSAKKLSDKGVKIVGGDLSNVNDIFANASAVGSGPVGGIFVALVGQLRNRISHTDTNRLHKVPVVLLLKKSKAKLSSMQL